MTQHDACALLRAFGARRSLGRAALAITLTGVVVSGLAACTSASSSPVTSPRSSSASAASAGLHMISHDGHRLAFYVIPGHLPALVLDAGGGNDASSWNKIAPALAEQTGAEVITYDRSGEGRSSAVPGPWLVQDAVSDLRAGLVQLRAVNHIVLVSHSLAGEIATYYVRQYSDDVAGAVLVDASLPPFYTHSEIDRIISATTPVIATAKRAPSTQATRQLLSEAVNYGPAHRAYYGLTWPQNVPATVIVSATTPYTGIDARRWRQAAAAFVHDAANRRYVTALRSSHDIELDRPDLVIAEVEAMATTAR